MTSERLVELPMGAIDCAPQVRQKIDAEQLAGLAQSLCELGLQQPILVQRHGNRWLLIDGHRRFEAAKLCGWTTIPAIIATGELSQVDVVERQLVTACQRADLTPMEKARAIDHLMRETSWTAAKVASRLGLSPASVSKLLALLVLPADAQSRVESGELAASTAYEIIRTVDAGERAQLLEEVRRGPLTRDAVMSRRRARNRSRATGTLRPSRKPARERVVLPLGGGRSVTLSGPVLSVPTLVQWIEELLSRLRAASDGAADVHQLARTIAAAGGPP